jgi:hypothetical protein
MTTVAGVLNYLLTDVNAGAQNAAFIRNACTRGGRIQLPAGTFYVDAITVGNQCTIVGAGSSDGYAATNGGSASNGTQGAVYSNESEIAATKLIMTSTTASMFQINAHGVSIENLHMSNQATTEPTDGAAVTVGASGTPANGFSMRGCSTNRFYRSVDIVNCDAYTIAFNKLIGAVKGGIRTSNTENQDEGDPIIMGNWIMSGKNAAAPDYGILYAGGGGLKIIGNKISRKGATAAADSVRTKKGIVLQPPANVTSSVFTITGNSIEAIDEDCIFIDATNASVTNVCITGNEFNCSPSLTNYVLRAQSGSFIPALVYFGNNTIKGCYTMVRSSYFTGINIGPNTIDGALLTGPLIDLANGVSVGYRLDEQVLNNRAAGAVLLKDSTGTNYASNALRQATSKRVVREMPAFATTSTKKALFVIDLTTPQTTGNIVRLDIEFNGFASGPGAFSSRVQRFLYATGTNTCAVSTPVGWTDINYAPGGADTTAGFLTWQFDFASGILTVSVTGVPAATTPNLDTTFSGVFCGEVTLDINGTIKQLTVS